MDKFRKICWHHWKEPLKISKIAKFEKDLLKANEDTAPQSCKILQTFVWLINFICQDIARTIAQNVLEAFQCFPQLVIRHFQQSVLEAIMKDSQWQRYSYWTRVWLILEGKNYFCYPAGRLFEGHSLNVLSFIHGLPIRAKLWLDEWLYHKGGRNNFQKIKAENWWSKYGERNVVWLSTAN